MKHFNYAPFAEALEQLVREQESPVAARALSRLKFTVLGVAWTDHRIWHPDTDKEEAMAWAWEDMQVAFAGFGDSALTGVIINLWTSLDRNIWDEARGALNEALMACEKTTPKTVPRRYLLQYRMKSVRTPTQGFDLPAVVPVTGPRMREWAESNGMPPERAEEQMALIEEYERMGLIDLESEGFFVGHGGVQFEPGLPLPEDIELRAPASPHLRLV